MDSRDSAASSPADRSIAWIIRVLQERHRPDGLLRRLLRRVRVLLGWLAAANALALVALFLAFRWWGERSPILGFLLYLPAQLWLLPSLFLAAPCLLVRPRLALLNVACAAGVVIVLMDFHWGSAAETVKPTLTVVTNNRGQDNGQSLTPFLQAENPDLLILQEDGRAAAFARAFPDRFCVSHGEFTLVSKFPIKESGFLTSPTWEGSPIAAWFLVDCRGQPLMVYNVHLPTPRNELNKLRGRALVATALPLPSARMTDFRERARKIWQERVTLAAALAAILEKESRPAIIAGDFNMPPAGHVRSLFGRALHDTFAERGRGFGFTFPGVTRNPISLFGPWLRIDYAFSNQRLQPIYVRTEAQRHSQHRAVAARFIMTDAK